MTLLPGAWTLLNTSTQGVNWLTGNGSAQRIYEKRFEQTFPHSKSIAQGWAALKLYLLGEIAEGAVMGRGDVLFTAEEFKAPVKGADLRIELERAIAILRPTDAELVPILIPDKARMRADALPHARSAPFEDRYDKALKLLRSYAPNTVDLRSTLSVAGAFMRTDTHWSPLGAESAASTIAELLSQHLDHDENYVTRPLGSEAFVGDLVTFADTGPWRQTVGPMQETIQSFETVRTMTSFEEGGDLFGDVAIPVVLIGTSFSAKPEFHFEGFLKTALQAAVLNLAQVGRGPFAPMRDYLAQFNQDELPPKVVLWEIPERYITPQ
jgi:alginate O-acetyltransferase complex protein AlgJ